MLLRLIVGDDEAQIAAIRRLMTQEVLFVSLTVLLETGWVLESRYRMARSAVADALSEVIALQQIVTQRLATVSWAIERYRLGADLADVIHLASAIKTGGFATLDRKLARQAGERSPTAIHTLG